MRRGHTGVNYFPVFFDLQGQKVLVVGGGEVALRKVSLLQPTGARITLVAPGSTPNLPSAPRPARSRSRAANSFPAIWTTCAS